MKSGHGCNGRGPSIHKFCATSTCFFLSLALPNCGNFQRCTELGSWVIHVTASNYSQRSYATPNTDKIQWPLTDQDHNMLERMGPNQRYIYLNWYGQTMYNNSNVPLRSTSFWRLQLSTQLSFLAEYFHFQSLCCSSLVLHVTCSQLSNLFLKYLFNK